jgi:hypothetical protein
LRHHCHHGGHGDSLRTGDEHLHPSGNDYVLKRTGNGQLGCKRSEFPDNDKPANGYIDGLNGKRFARNGYGKFLGESFVHLHGKQPFHGTGILRSSYDYHDGTDNAFGVLRGTNDFRSFYDDGHFQCG